MSIIEMVFRSYVFEKQINKFFLDYVKSGLKEVV